MKVWGFALWLVALGAAASCGARSGLRVPPELPAPPSSAFCGKASYRGGFQNLDLYLVLDRSGSMAMDNKWSDASAAIATFVNDPGTAGIGMGLLMFPRDTVCNAAAYDLPDVPIGPVAATGVPIENALAGAPLDGNTPTRLALRAAITYARAVMQADASREVVVALLTDGAPNECDSSDDALAFVAAQGASVAPQVRTFVIGLATGYLTSLSVIAAAGGTGAPAIIGQDGAAQGLIDAFRDLRAQAEGCRYGLPPIDPGAAPQASDVSVTIGAKKLARAASAAACQADTFWVDDPPTRVTLCLTTCDAVRADPAARVDVTFGCGAGSQPVLPNGQCGSTVNFACVADCAAPHAVDPVCVAGVWSCPAGTKPQTSCSECDAVPHGCCTAGGGLAKASCIDGAWKCAPGAAMFGAPGCAPPAQCAALLPCATGSYCAVKQLTCGEAGTTGTCQPVPAGCGKAPELAACGCNGALYPSACAARAAGVDVSVSKCPKGPSDLRCGPLFCNPQTHACAKTTHVAADTELACVPLPPGCTSCNCKLCPCQPKCIHTPTGDGESCQLDGGAQTLTCIAP